MQEKGKEADEEIIKGKSRMSVDMKKTALEMLRVSEAVYILLSGHTHLPYVECDSETYDDQILVYYSEEDAKRRAKELLEEKTLVQIIKVEKKSFLPFYVSLYPMGVNCIVVNDGMPDRISIQLDELIRRSRPQQLPEGQVWVENPQLHLTAIYFMQELYKNQGKEMSEEMSELYEEMLAHFGRGKYIFAVGADKGIPALKGKDGKLYQPLFTDSQEFQKFNGPNKLRAMVVEADKIRNLLPAESEGVVLNPMGVNVQFKIRRRPDN